MLAALLAGGGALLTACPQGADQCGDLRELDVVYNGTDHSTYVSLTEAQERAIGVWVGGAICTGTIIADQWVLTAVHCDISEGQQFCVGADMYNPEGCFEIARIINSPTYSYLGQTIQLDLALVELQDFHPADYDIEPIPIVTQPLEFFVGDTAEAGGFGSQEDGSIGYKQFVASRIESVAPPSDGAQFIRIAGDGEKGVCGGDSGGPLMVFDSTGVVRVAGALKGGDSSCVGYDRFTRVDFMKEWIETYTGVTPNPNGVPGCGDITEEGLCTGGRALYCLGNKLWADSCPNTCGWSIEDSAYRCIEGSDPCRGVDVLGSCDRNAAVWCDAGEVKRRSCDCEGTTCVDDPSYGAYCQ